MAGMLGGFCPWSRRAIDPRRTPVVVQLATVAVLLLSVELRGQTPESQAPPEPAPQGQTPESQAPTGEATQVPETTQIPEPALATLTPPVQAQEGERWFPRFDRSDFQGSLWTSYRYRSTYHEHDQDLYQSLLLNIGKPERDRITFTFQGQAFYDLDLNHPDSAFYSVQDTYSSRLTTQLLQAYADF